MKTNWMSWGVLGLGLSLLSGCATPRTPNPIFRHMFTADPSAHVWEDGRLYLYPSTDVAPAVGCSRMDGYHVFSTDDLGSWTDHGEILHSRDVEWGRPEGGFMWAPDCAYRDGTYYYYFPHPSETAFNDSWKIGIATSTSPTSGFELQGYMNGVSSLIDPCVFVDEDGQAYFYNGGSQQCQGGKLTDNMMQIDGEMKDMEGLDEFHEGAWVFKRNGIYYMIYPDNTQPCNAMLYAMSDHPLGPWRSQGRMMDPVTSHTMHGSVVEYQGQWYIFYHNAALSGGIGNLRSVCFDELFFTEDGRIQKVIKTQPLEEEVVSSPGDIKNASFEQATGYFIYGWATRTKEITRSDDTAVDGLYSLKYEGKGVQPVAQTVPLLPNTEYTVSFSVKADPSSKGALVFDTQDQFDDTCQFLIQPNSVEEWTRISGTFNSGEYTSVTLRFFSSEDFDGTAYWDALDLDVVGE